MDVGKGLEQGAEAKEGLLIALHGVFCGEKIQ